VLDVGESSKAVRQYVYPMGEYAKPNFIGTKRMVLAKKKSSGKGIWIMRQRKYSRTQFAVCIDNSQYPVSLELHKVYRVLPDADAARDGDLRIIDESGEDYLYPADYFVMIDLPRGIKHVLQRSFVHTLRRVTA
jgi:hypothetical protein